MWILHGVLQKDGRPAAARCAALVARKLAAAPLLRRALSATAPRICAFHALGLTVCATHLAVAPSKRAAVEAALGDPAAAEALALAHAELLNRIAAETTVAPARLGAASPTKSALLSGVAEQRAALLADLAQVRGRAEYVLKFSAAAAGPASTPPAAQPPRTGRSYLQSKLAARRAGRDRSQAAAAVIERVCADAAQLATLSHFAAGPTQRDPARRAALTLLVPRAAAPSLEALVAAAAAQAAAMGLELSASGPWAPFSFVGAPPEQERAA